MQTKELPMTQSKDTQWEQLFDQMEETAPLSLTQEIQYLEMKQMVEIQFRFRERLRATLDQYRSWKREYAAQKDDVEKRYSGYDGIFIRHQLQDAWKMYMRVNQDYHEMYRTYMDQIEKKKAQPFSYKRYGNAA